MTLLSTQFTGIVDGVVAVIGGLKVVTGGFVVGYLEEHVLQHFAGFSKQDFSDQVMQKRPISSHLTGVIGVSVSDVVTVVTSGGSVVNGGSGVGNFNAHVRQHLIGSF